MVKPKRLQPGDRVAAISMSWGGPEKFPHRYQTGKRQFEDEFSVSVVETRHALRDAAWLARNPKARADDLMEAFSDRSIQGIIATIGGDDSIRLLPYIDTAVIRSNPKVMLGYSDTTIAHLLCHSVGMVSFYGPSFMTGFGESGGIFPYTVDAVRRTIFSALPAGVIEANAHGWTAERLDWVNTENQQRKRALTSNAGWRFLHGHGVAKGRLIGGCLDVLSFVRGTPLWPSLDAFNGAILFLETSEEAPAPVMLERELRSYAAMGILQRLAGVLFGRPGGNVPKEVFKDYDDAILRIVDEEQGLDSLPVVTRMDFGHTDPMFVLPYGIHARVDCGNQQFEITESAVTE